MSAQRAGGGAAMLLVEAEIQFAKSSDRNGAGDHSLFGLTSRNAIRTSGSDLGELPGKADLLGPIRSAGTGLLPVCRRSRQSEEPPRLRLWTNFRLADAVTRRSTA